MIKKRMWTKFVIVGMIALVSLPLTITPALALPVSTIQDDKWDFNFADHETGESNPRPKEDATSTYVWCQYMNVDHCNLYVDGLIGGTRQNCTIRGYAYLEDVGQFLIYQSVFEDNGYWSTTAWLTGYRQGANQGWAGGLWSPDSVGNYPVLNT